MPGYSARKLYHKSITLIYIPYQLMFTYGSPQAPLQQQNVAIYFFLLLPLLPPSVPALIGKCKVCHKMGLLYPQKRIFIDI
jgi:hypothetical protein